MPQAKETIGLFISKLFVWVTFMCCVGMGDAVVMCPYSLLRCAGTIGPDSFIAALDLALCLCGALVGGVIWAEMICRRPKRRVLQALLWGILAGMAATVLADLGIMVHAGPSHGDWAMFLVSLLVSIVSGGFSGLLGLAIIQINKSQA